MATLNKKLIVIVGPTASGKSEMAVRLAKKFNGEIISADSRQVYKGMDIGTGKVTPDTNPALYTASNYFSMPRGRDSTGQVKKKCIFTHKGIPHHCIDVASPKRRFTVTQYRKLAQRAINKIQKKNKIPIFCGGTGFYIQAVVDGLIIPEVKPDWKLRKKLELIAAEELFSQLKKLDSKRAKTIEKKNKRRLIRALEIVKKIGRVPILKRKPLPYPVLILGIKKSSEDLKKLIKERLLKRLGRGMIAEVKKLRKSGLSWKRLEEFGLEYRYIAYYLQKKLDYQEMLEKLQKEIEHYAKRQMTWFSTHGGSASGGKRNRRIIWIKNYQEAEKLVREFLRKNGNI